MPAILAPEHEADWLDPGTPPAALEQLLAGLPARHTVLTEVGPAVNDARRDAPDCLDPPAREAQASLF